MRMTVVKEAATYGRRNAGSRECSGLSAYKYVNPKSTEVVDFLVQWNAPWKVHEVFWVISFF